MQSINAGFQSLRALLPHREGEKLSKAAILQGTADYVYQLEQEKTRLLEQYAQLNRKSLNSPHNDSDGSCSGSPLSKRKKHDIDSGDEGIGSSSPSRSDNGLDDVKREIVELRIQLEHERALRMILEEQIRTGGHRFYTSDDGSEHADTIHLQYNSGTEDAVKSSMSVMNIGHESGLGSPQSQISSQDIESIHEMSLRESSPDLSGAESPEDLSGKSNPMLLPSVDDLSISDMATIPDLLMTTSPLNGSSPFPIEINDTNQAAYNVSTSRQNLETIVEAIRHVEGDHMFRDDPTPEDMKFSRIIKQEKLTVEQFGEQNLQFAHCLNHTDFSFRHQIIRNAPLTQPRPGVIVSNLS